MRIPALFACVFLLASDARAQPPEPIGPLAVDVRAALPRFNENADVATALGVSSENLPGRGLGLSGGAHWYPVRMGRVTVGFGAELLVSGASSTLESDEDDEVDGPTVNTRFWAFSPQVSLNFGTGRGWSYVSGGIGWGAFRTQREDTPVGEAASRPGVLNYGGGARWFAKDHLAFVFDLRFYAVSAQEPAPARPAYPQTTLMVISAGVSFK
jgi:hypothetical protein